VTEGYQRSNPRHSAAVPFAERELPQISKEMTRSRTGPYLSSMGTYVGIGIGAGALRFLWPRPDVSRATTCRLYQTGGHRKRHGFGSTVRAQFPECLGDVPLYRGAEMWSSSEIALLVEPLATNWSTWRSRTVRLMNGPYPKVQPDKTHRTVSNRTHIRNGRSARIRGRCASLALGIVRKRRCHAA